MIFSRQTRLSGLLPVALYMALLILSNPLAASARQTVPFQQGERLTYRVKLDGVDAGKVSLKVLPMERVDGRTARHFVMEASTSPLMDTLYRLRQRIDAWVDPAMTRSLLARKWSLRGKKEKETLITFDWEKALAQYASSRKKNARTDISPGTFDPLAPYSGTRKKRAPIDIPPGTFDPLAALYHARTVDMKTGSWCNLPLTNGKHWAMGRYKIGPRETIRIDNEAYDTFLIEPDTKSVRKLFPKGRNRKAQLWITADQRRIPVRVRISLPLGSIVCELTGAGTMVPEKQLPLPGSSPVPLIARTLLSSP